MMNVVAMEKELTGLYNERSKNLLNIERYDWYTKKIYELREQLNEVIFGKVKLDDDAEFQVGGAYKGAFLFVAPRSINARRFSIIPHPSRFVKAFCENFFIYFLS